jgi:hypothetical protein
LAGTVPALLGVNSRGDLPGQDCISPNKDFFVSRVDTRIDLLDERMDMIDKEFRQRYQSPNFSCQGQTLRSGDPLTEFVQCWGRKCLDDKGCSNDELCYRPPSEVAKDAPGHVCPVCAGSKLNPPGVTGCDCVWGQCIPK